MKTYTFYDEVFELPWYFFHGGDSGTASKKFSQLTKIEYEPCEFSHGAYFLSKKIGDLVSFGIWLPKKFTIPVLVHESSHAVNAIMWQKDIPNNNCTMETYAYYQEMIVRNILAKIKKGDRI